MQRTIAATYGGTNAWVGEMLVNRMMPNRYMEAVGPFVFLDHIYPYAVKPKGNTIPDGAFAHPHRGIATFSYVLSGSLEHYDSKGHHGMVSAGGAQWMKAGNGIVHDEEPGADDRPGGDMFHSLQFWINLPPDVKEQEPEYLNISADEFEIIELPDNAGTMKVLIGACGEHKAPVQTYTPHFLYHFRLNPKSGYTLETKSQWEYAAFAPDKPVEINQAIVANSEIVVFGAGAGSITMNNNSIQPADVFIFGGEPYQDTIVAEGPFVMTSRAGIALAYRDFFNGKYGTIDYKR